MPTSDPTQGKDSISKAVRRNLSPRRLITLCGRMAGVLRHRGWQALGREVHFRYRLATHGEIWRYRADIPLGRELRAQRAEVMEYAPLVSVIVPVYNTPAKFLREMVASVQAQSYQNWELVAVDASSEGNEAPLAYLKQVASSDGRVRPVRLAENLGIAGNTNAGFEAARGEWLCLLDHDDVLQPNALYELVKAAGETGADLIYSDEVVLSADLARLVEFHFKPDFGPDTLRGCNYITHLCGFTRALLERAGGGEDSRFDGAQDYDLVLRLTEEAQLVHHIPKVLYFWRQHEGSTASGIEQKPYALEAGAEAINAQLKRLKLKGAAEPIKGHAGAYRVRYKVRGAPLVSVLIPSMDHVEDLERCIVSLIAKSGWRETEILVIENNSKEPATEAFYQYAEARWPNVRVVRYTGPFNFAAICNFGAGRAEGEHLLLLNNDTEILSEDFLKELLGYSQRPDVGAVGAMLYYPDDTVQHGGLIMGIGGTAGTSHKGHERGDGGDMFRLCTTQNMSAVTGACLMVKKSLWDAVGGMDEVDFAVAFNDVDFCLRLQELGYLNVFTPFAEGYHYESKSRGYDTEGPNKARFEREAANFRRRHAGILLAGDPWYNPHFTLKFENFGYR